MDKSLIGSCMSIDWKQMKMELLIRQGLITFSFLQTESCLINYYIKIYLQTCQELVISTT